MASFKAGVAKTSITHDQMGLQLQGMSDPRQQSSGVKHLLYSRAFWMEDQNGETIVIVIVDFWSCTKNIKEEVLQKLNAGGLQLDAAHLMISGTHTHSAPGAYTCYKLFNVPSSAQNLETTQVIVDGIAESIETAYKNRKHTRVYICRGTVENCGENRSPEAYNNNPPEERAKYTKNVDDEMLLLKFEQVTANGNKLIGALNWHAIHPIVLGQDNTLISGDNKGVASAIIEDHHKGIVAAFANSNCGDVSGRVSKAQQTDQQLLDKHSAELVKVAEQLLAQKGAEVKGTIKAYYNVVDMSKVRIKNSTKRTWPYALGLSFTAGSTVDSVAIFADPWTKEFKSVVDEYGVYEGITTQNISRKLSLTKRIMQWTVNLIYRNIPPLGPKFPKGHAPKPIVFAPGNSERLIPHNMPIQLFRIGDLAIAGIPGEITTMAGRRMKETIINAFEDDPINEVALSTYANDYAQYITTKEEYELQYYEGASTPFGPHTLEAYQQEFQRLESSS